jgi:hypothetical protein
MKGIVVYNSIIPKLFSWVIEIYAITLFPFIFIRDNGEVVTENHESIHIAQYAELFVFGFLFLYVLDFFKGLIKYRNKEKAYMMIRFEQEAFEMEKDLNYLDNRESFAWRKYRV